MSAYKPGTALHTAVPPALRPRFDSALAFSPKVFVLVSILASAFLCHFVAPNFYNELTPGEGAAADAGSRKMKRFSLLTVSSWPYPPGPP